MQNIGGGVGALADVFPVLQMQDSVPTTSTNGGLLSVCGISNGTNNDVATRLKYLGLNISAVNPSNGTTGATLNEDRSRTNLIINYLPQSYDQHDLQRLFERVGPIRQCKLIRDKNTGASLCYGFVDFVSPHHAALAIQTYHGYETEQKRLRVAYASSGGRRFNSSRIANFVNSSSISSGLSNEAVSENIIGWELVVVNAPIEWTETDLTRLFSNFGNVLLVRVLAPQLNDSPPCHKPRLSSPILNNMAADLGSDSSDSCRITTNASIIFEEKSSAEAAVLRLNGFQLQDWLSPLVLRIIGGVTRDTYRLFCLPSSQEPDVLTNLINRRTAYQSHPMPQGVESSFLSNEIGTINQSAYALPRPIIRNKVNDVFSPGLTHGNSSDILDFLEHHSGNANVNTDRLSARDLSLLNSLITHKISDVDAKMEQPIRSGAPNSSAWTLQNRVTTLQDSVRGGDTINHPLTYNSVKRLALRTPLLPSQVLTNLSCQLGSQVQIHLKLENIQPTGSFKIRGLEVICRKWSAQGVNHIVCPSGGNCAIAAAHAAHVYGMSCTIVAPETSEQFLRRRLMVEAPETKMIVHGSEWTEAYHHAEQLVTDLHSSGQGCDSVRLLHPYDQPELWEGYETIVEEISHDIGQPDAIVVPVGGGGLLAGIIQGLWNLGWSSTHVIAVETDTSDCFNRSMKAGHLLPMQRTNSIATSLVAPVLAPRAWNLAQCQSISAITCTDTEALDAVKNFLDDHGMLVEPACGAVLSVVYSGVIGRLQLAGRIPRPANVVCIIGGGSNVSLRQLVDWESQLHRFAADQLISNLIPSVTNHIPHSNFLPDLSRTSPLISVTGDFEPKISCNGFNQPLAQDPDETLKIGGASVTGDITIPTTPRSICSMLLRPVPTIDGASSVLAAVHEANGSNSNDPRNDDGADTTNGSLHPHDLVNFSKLFASDTDGHD